MSITAWRQPKSTTHVVQPLRVAVSGMKRLSWLVAFAQQAAGRMDPARERRLIRSLGFCLGDVRLRREDSGELVDLSALTSSAQGIDLPLRRTDNVKSLVEKLVLIRAAVHTLVRRYLAGRQEQEEVEAVVILRRRLGALVRDEPEAHDLRDALAYVLIADLTQFGERLLSCRDARCRRLFVRTGRQRYCTGSCRNRVTFQRWYRRHKGIRRSKHKAAITVRLMRARRKIRNRRVLSA
ncbi:MAG: CGNR zinc finger domain-containing protein [Nitrospiraceae bacterium]|nr:CGNR zinc finger domain-containing protein [Nitrospiraceae bacterium]